jgi:glyoxylase-like metal-dependent hydrolase (beta-lactamase superfamily II)
MKAERKALIKSMHKKNIEKLDAIFLTHSHTDHAANARYLSDIYNCTVYVFENGLSDIKNGICSIPKGTSLFGKAVCFLGNRTPFYKFNKFDACINIKPLTEDVIRRYLGVNAELIYTPGHTADSVSIIVDNKIIFLGDCAVNVLGDKYPPFADDKDLLKKTWYDLINIGAELYCPAHGKPFGYNEFKKAYDRLNIIN